MYLPSGAGLQTRSRLISQFERSGNLRIDRLAAASLANELEINKNQTTKALARLGKTLSSITELPKVSPPSSFEATLRPYQLDGFRWLHFLSSHHLNGILADDMGLGKNVQTLAYLATLPRQDQDALPSLIVAPTSVIANWELEAERFTPSIKTLLLQGAGRSLLFSQIPDQHLVLTSYPLLHRDREVLLKQEWKTIILDEAQYIKNPKTNAAQVACQLKSEHRFCLSGTPMENHLGELWSLMRFTMPGYLGDENSFSTNFRRPIERHQDTGVQKILNRRVSPLLLRRTKDEVARDLPPKTELLHHISLSKKESDLYESVRAAMDKRVRDALAAKGIAKSQIIILDALLKLRQICCHPSLLKTESAKKVRTASKMTFLTEELLPGLVEEGRRILLFSQFTSVLKLIENNVQTKNIPHLKLTGQTKNRSALVKSFQTGKFPLFLISLKAGGTGLTLTAADTVVHYDPWWNPAAENQATDRAHRIGQTKPVFVHKLICQGSIEDHIFTLRKRKAKLVKSLLSKETSKLTIDSETLSQLFEPFP
ncbi:MAG: DEAD/DEAH box helicase [Verrucomicrobiota bacterium JB023]|nr:DEAD/DEAH box helicase [Verrucomicrobiota bacterium JB023]